MSPSPVETFAAALDLAKLPAHANSLMASVMAWSLIYSGAHHFSKGSSHYRKLSPIKQADWCIHIVSSVHATLIILLAYPIFDNPTLKADKILAYDPYAGFVYSIAAGYFLWDSVICLWNVKQFGIGFALHGVACLAVFMLSFRPFLMYYGAAFLMFELSTPFLNIHWFCDKTGRTGSTLQLVNGIVLIAAFFMARIVFGFINSYDFAVTCMSRMDDIPTAYVYVYGIANILLNGLNVFWLSKMITALTSRFSASKRKPVGSSKKAAVAALYPAADVVAKASIDKQR
ncbi:hypothetical protein PhCBS80983_g00182 [Powellomyces hirtus]|uniref:TLC domain-containing protein n=1 Tax=Powellomyces hirtus TaxID=109895 RepID=A0A507EI00_9FUNG|nr:hypothetical protein PhCBS80983_g00182 [Powellomyces hirtus]